MQGKTCVITGATDGIGKATAMGLAKMGASIVIIGRNQSHGDAARDEIRTNSHNPNVDFMLADLSSQSAIRQLAADIIARYRQVHVLINNAGISPTRRVETADGIEATFAVNYLAPFLLTNLVLGRLIESAPARVVNVAGDYHRRASIQFEDLMSEKDYNYARANNQAKLALILFTYELARRLTGTKVTANCLHPGAVGTNGPLKDPNLSPYARFMYSLVKPFFLSPEKGAATSIFLASSPEVQDVSGKYFIKQAPVASSPASYDIPLAQRLWEVSAKLTGLDGAWQV
ncbi:MAG: SDR family oxidoreductase [Acidobacteriaceae bacterium]